MDVKEQGCGWVGGGCYVQSRTGSRNKEDSGFLVAAGILAPHAPCTHSDLFSRPSSPIHHLTLDAIPTLTLLGPRPADTPAPSKGRPIVSAMPAASTSAAVNAGPSSSQPEPTTSSLLLSTLGAYSDLTKQLFALIENPSLSKPRSISDASADRTWSVKDIHGALSALHDVDQLLASRIQLAHQHAVNQAKIERLQAQAKRRDKETRQAILEFSQISGELAEITRLSEEEVASIERAEKRPVGHATLLAYAQRLARYTSAPPGYKLPQVAAATKTNEEGGNKSEAPAEGAATAAEEALTLGPDYNQYAKRAAAYYDPAIPSMPQEMPFPSDAMMRQGILNSSEMLNGAPMAEQPADEMVEDADELPATDFASSYSHLREQQRQEEDEDAFDLDLN